MAIEAALAVIADMLSTESLSTEEDSEKVESFPRAMPSAVKESRQENDPDLQRSIKHQRLCLIQMLLSCMIRMLTF